ncbi:MAG TPA: hypothetical protein VGW35_00225 [Methylomirabilota bacterium]|nr:hypothetical protein [Methylomirabilota bacterium]
MSGRARAALILGLLLPLALAACGRRGPPVAPERRLPAAIQDLSAAVVGEGVRLQWTLPRIRVDRGPIQELRRTEVYRRLEQDGEETPRRPAILTFGGLFGPPGAVAGFDRVANIRLAEPAPAEVTGNQVTYTDTQGLGFGERYTYVVLAIDAQGRPSPPSNRVTIDRDAPPRPPAAVTALAGDSEVRLSWRVPETLEDGSRPRGRIFYNVFRTTSPEARPTSPVNPEPIPTPSYVDLTAQNDTTYYYSIRALLGVGGPTSRPTEVVAATPEDRTPPAQPRGLVAVLAPGAVRLAWEAVTDSDLGGYRVYRSTTAGRGYQPLTPAPQSATTYVDTDVRPGQTYYYVVTAVDRSRRANESIPSPETAVTLP